VNKKTIDKFIDRFDINEICDLVEGDKKVKISELKTYDFLIDFRGTNKYNEKINLLKNNLKTENALNYIKEIEVINKIFSECTKLQNAINVVPSKLVLPLMLYWGSCCVDEFKSPKAEKFFKENNADKIVAYEKNAEMTIQAIKSLMYNEKIFDGNKFIYKLRSYRIFYSKTKYQKCIMKYITDSYMASYWFEKYGYWKKGVYGLSNYK